jgi:fluoride exporter
LTYEATLRILLIGLGGFVGSILRYWLSGVAQNAAAGSVFPIGTLVVNVIGCFAIGVLSELAETHGFMTPETRGLLIVGLIGGFTTFSAFANETLNAVRDGSVVTALVNVVLSVAVGLAAVWGGRIVAALLWR